MKTILISFFILFTVASYSQTTELEYNYITNGYKVQVIEQGGDLKKGYSLKDLGEWKLNFKDGDRKVVFKAFYRDTDSKPCAIMAIYEKYNKDGEVTYSEYYCIPSGDENSLWDRTIEQLNSHYDEFRANEFYEAMLVGFMHFALQLETK